MAAKKAKKKPSAKQLADVIIVKGTGSRDAEAVLKARGYKVLSHWVEDNLFEKAGQQYKIAHPVWRGNDVRVKPAKKRNGKTIVKAKRVTIVQMPKKMNPVSPSAILRQVPAEKREAVKAAIEQAKTGRLAGLKAADGILESVGYAHNSKISRLVWAIGNQASLKQSRTVNPRKRNGTVIKAKRIEHLDVSKIHSLGAVPNPARAARAKARKNPALEILREAKPAKRGNQQGWLLGKEFIAKGKGTKKLPGGALFDTNAGFVYRRVENPKRKKNIAGFMQDGVFHPIRSGIEQRTTKSGTRRVKSKKAYKPSKVGEKFTYSPKKSAKRASQTKRMKAATAQRKATTTRLATRSLQRSYPLKGKRNPNNAAKAGYESFQGKTSTKSTALNFPNGTPANVYKLGSLHSITLADGRTIKPAGKAVWLCADTKGKLHLGTTGERLTNAPKGSLGKVKEVEYITSKPHLGEPTVSRYFHKLGEETGEKPMLYSDGNGGLIFKGGAYSITSRGIVN